MESVIPSVVYHLPEQEKEAAMGRELAREMGHGRVATTMKHYAPCPRLVPEGVKPE